MISSLGGGGVANPQSNLQASALALEIARAQAAQSAKSTVANVADVTLGKPAIDKKFSELKHLFDDADHAKVGGKPAFDETTVHDRSSGDTTTTVHVGDGAELSRTKGGDHSTTYVAKTKAPDGSTTGLAVSRDAKGESIADWATSGDGSNISYNATSIQKNGDTEHMYVTAQVADTPQ